MNRSLVAVTVRLVASSSTIGPLIQFKPELAETIQERVDGRSPSSITMYATIRRKPPVSSKDQLKEQRKGGVAGHK